MDSCIFCDIANKKKFSHIIYEDQQFLAFLSIFPNTAGVTVVIPKQHYSSYIFDLSQEVLIELMVFCRIVAKRIDNYFEDVGRTALVFEGFGVDHVHAKLFPMHGTQHLIKHWQPVHSNVSTYFQHYECYISSHDAEQANDDELAQLAKAIRDQKIL